jgi:hypothetical protein
MGKENSFAKRTAGKAFLAAPEQHSFVVIRRSMEFDEAPRVQNSKATTPSLRSVSIDNDKRDGLPMGACLPATGAPCVQCAEPPVAAKGKQLPGAQITPDFVIFSAQYDRSVGRVSMEGNLFPLLRAWAGDTRGRRIAESSLPARRQNVARARWHGICESPSE